MGDLVVVSENHPLTPMSHHSKQQQHYKKKMMMATTTTLQVSNNHYADGDGEDDVVFKKDLKDLEEMLSKLNPLAKEFVPRHYHRRHPATNKLHPNTPTPAATGKVF